MASQYKTKCPHCGAQFRIGREHLQQAGGKVRCGSCLEIFKATENLVDAPAAKKAAAGKPAPGKPAKDAKQQKKTATDDKPASRWTLDESADVDPAADPEKSASASNQPAPPREDRNDTKVSLDDMELSDSFLNIDDDSSDQLGGETFSDMAGAGEDKLSANADESWAEALLDELEDDEGSPSAQAESGARQASAPEEDTPAEEGLADLFREEPEPDETHQAHQRGQAQADETADEEPLGLFDDSDDGFSEIDIPQYSSRPQGTSTPTRDNRDSSGILKWGLLSLAAAVVLAGQYLVFNFNELARSPQWRPFYAQVCDLAGCRLPNPSSVEDLRGANLVVRSHPRIEGALVVDALLFNEADYEQPFPMLELDFTALQGRSVASRRFLPDEYLQGDLRELEAMPRNTPIRISFEIMDPGPEAVNYRMRLHPAPRDAS